MATSVLVHLLSLCSLASALLYGSKRDSVNLLSSAVTGGVQRAGVKANSSSTQPYYLLQRVGFEDSGPAKQPRSPHVSGAECLTVGNKDLKKGFALGWMPCQDLTTVASAAQLDEQLREKQLFLLNDDGSLSDKWGRCVRRVPCEEDQDGTSVVRGFIYDAFHCDQVDGKYVVRIKVEKAQANSVDHLRDMGWLKNAVTIDNCQLCGPYQLQNQCMSHSCGASYQAKPGWTKLASSYVGDAAVMGRSTVGVAGPQMGSDFEKEQLMGIDMSGIGYTRQASGMCGSWVTDSPAMDSYFYLLLDDTHSHS